MVVDPVMIATSGARLLAEDALDALRKRLLPLATVITPNLPEAELLLGWRIDSLAAMSQAATALLLDGRAGGRRRRLVCGRERRGSGLDRREVTDGVSVLGRQGGGVVVHGAAPAGVLDGSTPVDPS